MAEILVVHFNQKERERLLRMLDSYHQVSLVPFETLGEWVQRYKRADEIKAKPPTKRVAKTITAKVRANTEAIIVASEALALVIDEKIARLKGEKPNSPEAIAVKDATASEYQALKAKVLDLQAAVAKFSKQKIKEETLQKKAMLFGEGVSDWWTKNHVKAVERSMEMGVFLSAVGICSMIGVSPNVAAVTSAALIGGRPIVGALKGLGKHLLSGPS